ncbi:hypothetical protein OCOJLMKI_3300 [Methylobacterium iners]|uniref:TonB C-terminal domain-containing protein n=1 Tax=Methylobacterium iners TaxID=418707 RepID=A0ABQ4S0X2_9HYPH|nr:hypothetical protein [Methylobacterium iners]GJD96082.1 hypothetical protein OCOJLMKI_3300 [Methylobacterium iners]
MGCAIGGGFYGRQPPLSLPQTLRGTVQVPLPDSGHAFAQGGGKPADTLRELYPTLAACWEAPAGLAKLERTEITARFSLRRDGSLIGEPRITFATPPAETRARDILTEATVAAIRRCTPARITAALGGAIAGRPMALRFIYSGPRGQGI